MSKRLLLTGFLFIGLLFFIGCFLFVDFLFIGCFLLIGLLFVRFFCWR